MATLGSALTLVSSWLPSAPARGWETSTARGFPVASSREFEAASVSEFDVSSVLDMLVEKQIRFFLLGDQDLL